jgi:UDP-N-acetylglucosamine diphosphorylase / glucose-1-phosphate thymidylyltransferase / UDP-N-acetylgalactosamine diphosphorylase / glucosamine-1-phosphate N-acetyltransferase / galactosamine-1-phosphate N-acetyltransferase
MMNLYDFVPSLVEVVDAGHLSIPPWELAADVEAVVAKTALTLNATNYRRRGDVWVHHSATVEDNVHFRGPGIIGADCFIAVNSLLRGGVILGPRTVVGFSVELKSVICCGSSDFAHLNYVGNSIIGKGVNFEAGSIVAVHLNETPGVTVKVNVGGQIIDTKQAKFGALVGDNCKIGANAVLSPGTILEPDTIVPRLTLIEQIPYSSL